MRRKDRQLTQEEAAMMMVGGEYGVFSTVGDQGYPYGVPVSYAYENGVIYFHCATEGHKLDALRTDGKCSFTVVGDTEVLAAKFSTKFESVIAFGQAKETEGAEKHQALMALVRKYSPEFLEKGEAYANRSGKETIVVKIEVDQMTAKARR